MQEGYNGWTNWETWKTHLEYFDEGIEVESVKYMELYMEEIMKETSSEGSLARSLTEHFLEKVDFEEIYEYLKLKEVEEE